MKRLSRIFAAILAFALLLGALPAGAIFDSFFETHSDWHFDLTQEPDRPMTVEEFIALTTAYSYWAVGIEGESPRDRDGDLPSDWAAPYIREETQKGVIKPAELDYDAPITLAGAMKFIVNSKGLYDINAINLRTFRGQEQLTTGKWIVYTSADSVFQVAAHEELIPLEELYAACRKAREILRGKHGVGRVIARPFVGTAADNFKRTSNRHDYSLEPPRQTMLDVIKAAGMDSIAVGKIHDIFAGRGDTEYVYNKSNTHGMAHAMDYAGKDFHGLCFVNLVDFDMLYGHRRDIDGYAAALSEFDAWLPDFLEKLGEEDLVLITADHGCDPGYTATTDHTREYVPLLVLGKAVKPGSLGTRKSFADIAATVTELLGVDFDTPGESFASQILK